MFEAAPGTIQQYAAGSFWLDGKEVALPAVLDLALPDRAWLKVVLVYVLPPFAVVGIDLDGGTFVGRLRLKEAVFRWPVDLSPCSCSREDEN